MTQTGDAAPTSAPSAPIRSVAVLGLGTMGAPIARHLARAGYELTLYNRSPERLSRWRDANPGLAAAVASTPAEAAEGAYAVITCVGNDDDLAEVVLGAEGVFAALGAGRLLIDHTTVSARIARQIAVEGRGRDILCVDAPMSGGQSGAENGTLSLMCGGTSEAVSAAEPLMRTYSSRIVHVGKAGAGQSCKMVNQVCIAGVLAGVAEGLRLAQAARLDLDKVHEAISGGAAQSWQLESRWPTMAREEFDFGFAIDWMRKDLGLALDEARGLGTALPVAALVDQFYAQLQILGSGREDTSALVRLLPRKGTQ